MAREQPSTESDSWCRRDCGVCRWLRPLCTFGLGPDDDDRSFDNHDFEFDDLDHRGAVDHDHDAGIDYDDNAADHDDDDATGLDDDTAAFDNVDCPSQFVDHLVDILDNDDHLRSGAGDPVGLQRPDLGWWRLVHERLEDLVDHRRTDRRRRWSCVHDGAVLASDPARVGRSERHR